MAALKCLAERAGLLPPRQYLREPNSLRIRSPPDLVPGGCFGRRVALGAQVDYVAFRPLPRAPSAQRRQSFLSDAVHSASQLLSCSAAVGATIAAMMWARSGTMHCMWRQREVASGRTAMQAPCFDRCSDLVQSSVFGDDTFCRQCLCT